VNPNIVLVLADDLGFSDLGCYGSEIETPHLDALAAGGVRMTRFTTTARCSPSRASLLTGLHPHQTGIGVLTGNDGPGGYPGSLNDRCVTAAEVLRDAGYTTYMSGKWHLSHEKANPSPAWPTRRGFQHFFGTLDGGGDYFAPQRLHRGEQDVSQEAVDDPDFYYTDAITDAAVGYIRNHRADRPFFCYVAYTAPPFPLHAREEDIARCAGRYREGWDVVRERRIERMRKLGILGDDVEASPRDPEVPAWDDAPDKAWEQRRMEVYAAMVESMDRGIGRIVDELRVTGQLDDTLFVFLSDNGGCAEELRSDPEAADRFRRHHLIIPPSAPDGTPMRVGNSPAIRPGTADTYTSYGQAWANLSNTPFRLYKRWVHEGGIATPLIVSWPAGGLTDGVIDAPHQLTDIAPTLLEATGVPALAERGDQQLPPLRGASMLDRLRGGSAVEHDLFWEHIGNAAVRSGDWKLVREFEGEWELYDLSVDRSESNNLAADHPERVADLARRWQTWADSVGVIPYADVLAARASMPDQPA
jgi:arylsulfatase A-like enzyme